MLPFIHRIIRSISSPQPVPRVYRSNFTHLYFDVVWFGLLNGSILAFLTIFATRQGAGGVQIGLINAIPAVVALVVSLPASTWLSNRPIGKGVFWSALIFRLFYIFLIPLPVLLSKSMQVWAVIAITLLMSIPGTILAVGFNALFAEAVPTEWRAHVAGIRGALVALTSTLTNLACGYILTHMKFETGYQVVFAIGFVGAMLSTLHLYLIQPLSVPPVTGGAAGIAAEQEETHPGQSFVQRVLGNLRLDILQGPFKRTLALLFLFHLGQYLAIPVFPLFTVNELHFSDQVLGIGSSIFNTATFLASFQLASTARKLGNQRVLGLGVIALSTYPFLIGLTHGTPLYYIASVTGGIAWALAGGVLYNYLLEKVPQYDRPFYLAWYQLAFNAAVLIGSLAGPALATRIGLATALLVYGVVRLTAGVSILRWGE